MAEATPQFEPKFDRTRYRKSAAPLFWVALAVALLAGFAHFALLWGLPLPRCWLRELTGIPCPTCGCTRSLASWASLDLTLAFRFNPLFFLTCAGFIFWSGLLMLERLTHVEVSRRIKNWVLRLPLGTLGFTLLFANWLYLYLTLPR